MLKKLCILLIFMLLLTGCGSWQTFETLGTIPQQSPTQASKQTIAIQLPEDAAQDTWQGEGETMYICDDYTISMKTFASGDLRATIQRLSGYKPEQLTIMQSSAGKAGRYDWVWTAVGENGDLVCRGAVLDDGHYHYCLSVMAEASVSGELTKEWNELFSSFRLDS